MLCALVSFFISLLFSPGPFNFISFFFLLSDFFLCNALVSQSMLGAKQSLLRHVVELLCVTSQGGRPGVGGWTEDENSNVKIKPVHEGLTVSCILQVTISALQSYCLSKHHVWIWLSFFYNWCLFFSVQCIFRPWVYNFRWESANEMRIIEMILTRKLLLYNLHSLTLYREQTATSSLWNNTHSNLSAMHYSINSGLYVSLALIPSKKKMFISNTVLYLCYQCVLMYFLV